MVCELEEWANSYLGIVPKKELPKLPECCEETWVGDPKGAIRQYRCAHGFHVREYGSWFEIHRDRFDPRKSPLAHMVADTEAPTILLGLVALLAVRAVYG